MTKIKGTIRAKFLNEEDPAKQARLTLKESEFYFGTMQKKLLEDLNKGDEVEIEYEDRKVGQNILHDIMNLKKFPKEQQATISQTVSMQQRSDEIMRAVIVKANAKLIWKHYKPKNTQTIAVLLKTEEEYIKTGSWEK